MTDGSSSISASLIEPVSYSVGPDLLFIERASFQ